MPLLAALAALALAADAGPAAARWTVLPAAERSARRTPVHRIYNGQPTGAYPAVAALVIFRADGAIGLCSATLVTADAVLTAAHCFLGDPVRVVAAFFPDGATEADYEGIAYLVHPEFDAARLAHADIALLALEAPVAGVAPMSLVERKPRPRTRGVIVGYGLDEQGTVGAKEMGTVRLRRCPRAFPAVGIPRGGLATSVCWRPRRRGQDTCQGDSGGPLVVHGALAGVTSGGYPNCPGRLSWNASVAAFRPWIVEALPAVTAADRP